VDSLGYLEQTHDGGVVVEYCGEWFQVSAGQEFTIGRQADLALDDNPFLHRELLSVRHEGGFWVLSNIGKRLPVTVTDGAARFQAWLPPGARLPLVFGRVSAVLSAGPTTYEISIFVAEPLFSETHPSRLVNKSPIVNVTLTTSQKVVILALAEAMLLSEEGTIGDIPTSAAAARRLGWTVTRFNRKLDNVCEKLDRAGVTGLRGGARSYATNRRVRLVEYAIAASLVTRADLSLLDEQPETEG